MADRYEDVVYQGFFSNLRDSIGGALVGVLLFLAAFPVLWWNEGRTDLSKVAKRSIVVGPDAVDPAGEGKLVSVTSPLAAPEAIGDPEFLNPGPYVRLHREVEMWAWVEHSETREEKKWGGGKEKRTIYTYVREWTNTPEKSASFKHPEGHENPPMPVPSKVFHPARATVGAYGFSPAEIGLPGMSPLPLDDDRVKLRNPRDRRDGDYVFRGRGDLSDPMLGDVRISFQSLSPGPVMTAFGEAHGADLLPYLYEEKDTLFRVVPGTRDAAIATLHTEHTTTTWLLRLLGFVLLWIGMGLFFSPLNAVLDIVPFAGTVGRTIAFVAMLPVALVIATVVITISAIAHSPILLAMTVVGTLIAGWVVIQKRRAKKQGKTW